MSMDLLNMMNKYGILRHFILKCVDDMEVLPKGLERVPTLIVSDIDKPLIAKDAVLWFNKMRSIFATQQSDSQNKHIMYNIMKNNQEQLQGPKGYTETEYNGISDAFAYTDVDMAQPKSFCTPDNDTDIIYTPPEDSKVSLADQNRLYKTLNDERRQEESAYSELMKKKQIDIIINNEQKKLMMEKIGLS